MPMFDFSPSSGHGPTLSSSFWIYWAVTVPFTLVLLGIWKVRMHIHEDHGIEPRHTEEKTIEAIRASYQTDSRTPLYPGKWLPDHAHYIQTPLSH